MEGDDHKAACDTLSQNLSFYNSPQFNFLFGECNFGMKNYEKALVYYKKVLEQNPNAPRAKLEIAKAYLHIGNKGDEAIAILESALQDDLPQNVKDKVTELLKKIKSSKTKDWRLKLSGGYVYDTNVNNSTYNRQVEIFGVPFKLDDNARAQKDNTFLAGINFDHKKHFFGKSGPYLINSLSGLKTKNDKHENYDMGLGSASTGFGFKLYKLTLEMPITYTQLTLNSNNFLRSFGYSPNLTYEFSKILHLNVGYNHKKNSYYQTQIKNRNGDYDSIASGLKYFFGNGNFLQLSYSKGTSGAKEKYYQYDLSTANAGLFLSLPIKKIEPLAIYLGAGRESDKYKDSDPLTIPQKKRRDKNVAMMVNIYKRFKSIDTTIVFGYTKISNDSNINIYQYKREQFSFKIEKDF